MRIIIVTPLYPPDIAPLAVYTKELARRLAPRADVTVIAFTTLPETLLGVRVIAVPKHIPLPLRLAALCIILAKEIRKDDIVFAQNGPSIELPLLVTSFVRHLKFFFRISDPVGYTYAQSHRRTQYVQRMLMQRARLVMVDPLLIPHTKFTARATPLTTPDSRPEILPFAPYPTEALTAFEQSWDTHIQTLLHIFTNEHST